MCGCFSKHDCDSHLLLGQTITIHAPPPRTPHVWLWAAAYSDIHLLGSARSLSCGLYLVLSPVCVLPPNTMHAVSRGQSTHRSVAASSRKVSWAPRSPYSPCRCGLPLSPRSAAHTFSRVMKSAEKGSGASKLSFPKETTASTAPAASIKTTLMPPTRQSATHLPANHTMPRVALPRTSRRVPDAGRTGSA